MNKRLLLHIGTGKTGTSSIQNCLFENRHLLASRYDVFYPEYGLSQTEHFGNVINAHYPVVSWITEKKLDPLKKLAEILHNSKCGLSVISCENFYHHLLPDHIAHISQVFSPFSVEIICYVRRQDLYMESAWKQQVKVGALKSPFPDFLKRHANPKYLNEIHANYHRMLAPWASVFGKSAIRVRVFDKSEWINGDLLDDFFNQCGIPPNTAVQLVKPNRVNSALPSELICLMQKTNAQTLVSKEEQNDFFNYLQKVAAFKDPPLLSRENRLAIIKNYVKSNRALFSEYLGKPIPSCFKLKAVTDNPNTKALDTSAMEHTLLRTIVGGWQEFKKNSKSDENNKSVTIRGRFLKNTFRSWFSPLPHPVSIKSENTQNPITSADLPWADRYSGPFGYAPSLKPKDIVDLIKNSQRNKSPLSIIRLGDGEGEVIAYPDHIPIEVFDSRIINYFGKHLITEEQRHELVQEVRNAVKSADVIGVVPGNQVNHFTIVRFFLDYYQLVSSNTRISTLSLHRNLQELGLYKEFLQDLDVLGIVTCRDVEESVRQIFNIKKIVAYKVPEDVKRAKNKNAVARHFPERFEEIRKTLEVPEPGMLFLVGAGALGKVYCRWIKERGGIALDIGSIFDAWAGLNTRSYMKNEEGELDKAYRLK